MISLIKNIKGEGKKLVIKSGLYDECGGECDKCVSFECKVNGAPKMVLTKKKVTQKYIPPDVQVLKLLYQEKSQKEDLVNMTDEELEKYEEKIVRKILESAKGGNKTLAK